MDRFGTSELRRLTGEQTGPCVTVYLPTHVSSEQGQQDPVRLKNLVQQVEDRLAESWMRAADARKLLKAARELPTDPAFWSERSHGLALFITPESFQRYRLPVKFDELAMVNRRFYVKPLLPLLTGGDRFFVLALSQNKVRLFAAARYGIQDVEVPGLPTDMDTALNYVGSDRGSQVHSAMRGSLGKQAAVFHGQGGQSDTRKDDLATFFRLVDAALQPVLREETTPLLLAGVEYLLPIYREVGSYAYVAQPELAGNCDYLTAHQIHQRAWPLMEPLFQRVREEAAAKYFRLAGTGKTSDDVQQIVPASHEGRIETLFVDLHSLQWGSFHPESNTIELHEQPQNGDDDLLDLAAVQTLLHRGTVYSVERDQVPSGRLAAAVFRY
jgi:hypothetical protein